MTTAAVPLTFHHSGKLGDIIYALAAMKQFPGSTLLLEPSFEFHDPDIELLLPLLQAQPYLASAKPFEGESFEVDLDAFRSHNVNLTNIADGHLRLVGLPAEVRDEAWLVVDEPANLGTRDVVFARSSRNHGPEGFWPECVRLLGFRARFVGTAEEHAAFVSEFGDIPHHPTKDLLELARVIAGCSLFVGNQSCPYAIAEALKKPAIQETFRVTPNCLFFRPDMLSVLLPSEVGKIEDFVRGKRDNAPLPKPGPEVRFGVPIPVPSALVVHDDWWFLRAAIRTYQAVGPVTVFISQRAWNGEIGRWDKCASEAEAAGAEVVVGEWPEEALHRRVALETMRQRGHRHILIPDGDEFAEPRLLEALVKLAWVDAADVVRVSMDTYWKSPRYRIRPAERLRPVLMVNAQTARHDYIREYEGPRLLVLGEDHGVIHHLSYAGPDERIERKLRTWGHRTEVVENWHLRVWQGWNRDPLMRDLHPTHPTFYGFTERIPTPAPLLGCRDDMPVNAAPEPSRRFPSVSVIIPLYGGPEDIRGCLASLEKCQDLIHETIVVDDVSPDNAAEVVTEFPFARLIRNEKNRGFAGTCNRGYAESTGDLVLFLNSDTVVPRAGLVRLIESLLEKGTVGAVGPRSNYVSGPQQLDPTYTSLENLDLFANDFAYREAEDEEVPMLVGFCVLARRSAIDEIGGAFDERFGRGMFEDNDLSYRLLRAGYKLRIAQRAFVHHAGSKSLARMEEPAAVLLRRNEGIFFEKWREDIESGYASHLSGQRGEPIVFDESRHPDKVRREMARLREQADISLCMIVRNEERVLGDCLNSVKGIFNQTIVVDTGSTDRTREIAKEHGVELYDFPWPNSFSIARNESLKYAKGKWIFWMDADDTLPKQSAEIILRAAAMAPTDVVGFVVPVQFVENGVAGGTRVDHVKLFRNVPGLEFEGRIHEQILASLRRAGGQIARLDAVVLHTGYDTSVEGQAKKRARDEVLLKLDLEERPGHPFVLFNLGMTAHYLHDHEEAVSWLRQSIEAAEPNESHVRKAYALMGVSYREMGDKEGALRTFEEGLATVGEDPELRFQAGIVLSDLGRLQEAYQHYTTMPRDVSGHFSSVDMGILGPKRSYNLAVVCLGMDRYKEAQGHLADAVSAGFGPAAALMHQTAAERGDFQNAERALTHWRQLEGPSPDWANALAAYAQSRGDNPEAALVRVLESEPGADGVRMALARGFLNSERVNEALPHLEYLAGRFNAEAIYFLGVVAVRRNDLYGALRYMRQAAILNPSHELTRNQIAAIEATIEADERETLAARAPGAEQILVGPHVGELGASSCPTSVVVVTYNSAATISECIRSVFDTVGPEDEVIVVDNSSPDDTVQIVENEFGQDPRLRLIQNPENSGYSRGANLGLLASHGEHLVLLNPDTIVFEGWLDSLHAAFGPGVAAAGPISNTVSNEQFVSFYLPPTYRPPLKVLPQAIREGFPHPVASTRFLAGFCVMLSREVLNRHGLLEEATELGADDLELSWRLRALGYKLMISPQCYVEHEGSVSFRATGESETSPRIRASDEALKAKLRSYYGLTLPRSMDLWGTQILEIQA